MGDKITVPEALLKGLTVLHVDVYTKLGMCRLNIRSLMESEEPAILVKQGMMVRRSAHALYTHSATRYNDGWSYELVSTSALVSKERERYFVVVDPDKEWKRVVEAD